MKIAVSRATYSLIEKSARRESRPAGSVVDDAVRLYDELHSDSYKQHLEAAHQFRISPVGSDEREVAADELARASARSKGIEVAQRGGSLASTMAQVRRLLATRAPS